MILQNSDLIIRFFGIFTIQIVMVVIFFCYFLKIRKRSKSRYAKILSSAYILIVIALLLNTIYFWLTIPILITILDFLMIYLLFICLILILFFILNLLYSIKILLKSTQLKIFIIYCSVTFIILFIPTVLGAGMIVVDNKPIYLWPLSITLYIFLAVAFIIPTLFFSFNVRNTISKPELKKRWDFFNIGYVFFSVAFYCLVTYLSFEEELIRLVISIFVFIIIIIGGFMIYYGSIKSLK